MYGVPTSSERISEHIVLNASELEQRLAEIKVDLSALRVELAVLGRIDAARLFDVIHRLGVFVQHQVLLALLEALLCLYEILLAINKQ